MNRGEGDHYIANARGQERTRGLERLYGINCRWRQCGEPASPNELWGCRFHGAVPLGSDYVGVLVNANE